MYVCMGFMWVGVCVLIFVFLCVGCVFILQWKFTVYADFFRYVCVLILFFMCCMFILQWKLTVYTDFFFLGRVLQVTGPVIRSVHGSEGKCADD